MSEPYSTQWQKCPRCGQERITSLSGFEAHETFCPVLQPVIERLLTQDEANALPDGFWIEVTWNGGNGPHRYRVHVEGDRRYAGDRRNDNELTFVGSERYHTHVRLVNVAVPATAGVRTAE